MSLFLLSSNKKKIVKTLPREKTEKKVSNTPLHSYKETPCDTCLSGILTVEAALVLPFLMCFFVSILFLFRVMQVQLVMHSAVCQTTEKLAVSMAEEEDIKIELAARRILKKKLSGTEHIEDYMAGGIRLLHSDWSGGKISLVVQYQVKWPVTIAGMTFKIPLVSKAVSHKWTGWQKGKGDTEDDRMVYITQTGSVYHETEDCTYLKLAIKSVTKKGLEQQRNENGGKYYPCQLCAKGSNTNSKGQIYITNQGNSYHYKLRCSGLKRTIYCIRLSAVGNRKPCSRCGKEE